MPILTPDTLDFIKQQVDGLHERIATQPVYPQARRRRPLRPGEELPAALEALPPPPTLAVQQRVRIMDFIPTATPATGSTMVSTSPRINGPALIDWIIWNADDHTNNNTSLSIFITDDGDKNEANQTTPITIIGQPVFEWNNRTNIGINIENPYSLVPLKAEAVATQRSPLMPIRYPVIKDTFFIKVRFGYRGVLQNLPLTHLIMRIVEGIDPSAIM